MSIPFRNPLYGLPEYLLPIDPLLTRQVQELKHGSPLIGCRLDPSGKFVFAGAQDNTIQRWELANGKKTTFSAHKSWVRAIAFHPTSNLMYSGGYEGKLIAWSVDSAAPSPTWARDAHKGWLRALAVSPDGKLLASCGNDLMIRLWSTADGKLLHELPGHASHVYNVAFHPVQPILVSADLKGVIRRWDLHRMKSAGDLDASVLYKFDTGFQADIGGVRSLAFSPNGTLLACAGITEVSNAFAGVGKPLLVLFDWLAGKAKLNLVPKEAFQGTAWGVICHPKGFIAGVGGGNGGMLWFWNPDQAQAFHAVKLPQNARDLDLHRDGRRLAVAFADGTLRIYAMSAKAISAKA